MLYFQCLQKLVNDLLMETLNLTLAEMPDTITCQAKIISSFEETATPTSRSFPTKKSRVDPHLVLKFSNQKRAILARRRVSTSRCKVTE